MQEIFKLMMEKGASDLHLRVGLPPVLRVKRTLERLQMQPLTAQKIEEFIFSIIDEKRRKELKEVLQCDFSYSISGVGRFRGSAFYQRGTLSAVFRAIPEAPSSFEELNLPKALEKICDYKNGLILVTGPAGSGKSTTLAAMLNYINENRTAHIITLEDPIEFFFKDKKSIITQRELGVDMVSYVMALKNVVREDPDVILVGEMRDIDTISAGLTAAELGNLVLSTLHTIDAIQTVSRIIDFFPVSHQNQVRIQLADLLRAVISMRLILSKDRTRLYPVCEILINTELVKKQIVENNISAIGDIMAKGSFYGMQTFNSALTELCERDLISEEDALSISTNPEELKLYLRGIDTRTAATGFE